MRIGAYEAKTHLPALLKRVARGERITITKHGRPVAVLVPPPGASRLSTAEAIAALRRAREGRTLGGLPVKEAIAEGRR